MAGRPFGARRSWAWLALLTVVVYEPAAAQPPVRRATNVAAIQAYPNFYHLRPVLLVGTVKQEANGDIRVSDSSGSLRVIPQGNAPDGVNEVRGQFWDIGRMKADDPRLAGMDLAATFRIDPEGAWPRPGDVTAIVEAAIVPAAAAGPSIESAESPGFPSATIRSIVLDPSRYVDRKVTVAGQFYGRNLTGDLPDAPGQSRYDFVLRSADASIWVANLRPRGKDLSGRNFEFSLDARSDTGKWLKISGTVRQGRGLLWIEGAEDTLAMVEAPTETVAEEAPVRVPAAPPPEVIFSAPTADEIDVSVATNIRIQFSRDVDPGTFKGRIRVSYAEPGDDSAGATPIAVDGFTTEYRAFNRVLELNFREPFERFRTLKVELLEGILGTDQQPLKPWVLTFALGGT
jgi:hypothetical protein